MSIKNLGQSFLIGCLLLSLLLAALILRPFGTIILVAAVLAILFYPVYRWLLKYLGNATLASIIMTTMIVAIIIVPTVNFAVELTDRSINAYNYVQTHLASGSLTGDFEIQLERLRGKFVGVVPFLQLENFNPRDYILSSSSQISDFLISTTKSLLRTTAEIVVSFILIVLSLFYFFKEGENWLKRVAALTPISNRYDQQIFKKFRDVSVASMITTVVIPVIQAFLAAFGFYLIGIPAFFLAVLTGFAALVPVVGTALVWLPVSLYLMFTGKIAAGALLLLYGFLVIGVIDNVLRAYLLKKRTEVHHLWIFFSILGGVGLFGFWGIIYGPLTLALAVTLLHIYELEFVPSREK